MADLIRTFVAFPLPPELHPGLRRLLARLGTSAASVRWINPSQAHLTLKFLGDVRSLDLPPVCQAVQTACRGRVPVDATLAGVGAFPDIKRPRTIWLSVAGGAEHVNMLQAAIEQALQVLGFPAEERAFRPHVTLGRVKRGFAGDGLSHLLREHHDYPLGRAKLGQVVVYSSELTPGGPQYTPVATVNLAGGG